MLREKYQKLLTLHIVIILQFPLTVFCQDEYLARLSISGAVSELGISPSEEIWIATKAGNVYYTYQIGHLWNIGSFGSLDPYNFSMGQTFERINFFSEDTMMISGFIQQDGKQDFVYWSSNHGRSWEKVKFGKSSWIDAAYINNKGKAWMSGSSQLIYYTEDNGRTWQEFDKVEQTGNLRFSTIHFAKDERTGLFGSTWNVLYRTKDNCQSWEKLQTPLIQNKYHRFSKKEKPNIRKIRMFGIYYIINQQGRVFISNSRSVEWRHLPKIIDFEVSESEQLYTINNDSTIELFDSDFSSVWKSKRKLDQYPIAIATKNEKLFAITFENIYKVNPDVFIASNLLTKQISIPEPHLKIQYKGEEFGFANKDILKYDNKRKQWFRFKTLAFSISSATILNDTLIIADASLKQYYRLNEHLKTVVKFDLPISLFNATADKVVELHFENGSQGCFHSDNSIKSFVRKRGQFVLDKTNSDSKYLNNMNHNIDEAIVNQLIEVIDNSRFTELSISDLNIRGKDITNFKKFINREEQRIRKSGIDIFDFENLYVFPGENIDFGFYKAIADSLFSMTSRNINNAFWQAYGNWSTTKNWRRVIFVFEGGKRLIVENSDDKPNYLYTPWIVSYEGLKFRTNSIKFGQTIDELTKGEFFIETARQKNYAIFKIADYMYRMKINDN